MTRTKDIGVDRRAQDVETLRDLVNAGMGDNTLRALTSDLAYLRAWSLRAIGRWGTVSRRALDPQSVNAVLSGRRWLDWTVGSFRRTDWERIPDGSGQSGHPPPRGDGAVTTSLGSTSIKLL
ncbi:hypothetical protein ACVITL_006918 [Rhizobium pisi]